jgi:methionyl-tRNA synthetase
MVGGQKMSKSLNNVICPFQLLAKGYEAETVRVYLLRNGGLEYDSSFSDIELVQLSRVYGWLYLILKLYLIFF